MSHAQRAGPQQGFRKLKLSNKGYKIVYVHLDDPLLLEHQKHLGQPDLRVQCFERKTSSATIASKALHKVKAASDSRGSSSLAGVDFHDLLSSLSEQTTFLRLLVDGREAVRFDRHVACSLTTLLLLGAIKVSHRNYVCSWLSG